MAKICNEDCFNCKYDDCMLDALGRYNEEPEPKELTEEQLKRKIKSARYYEKNKEAIKAQKKAYYYAHREEINAKRRKKKALEAYL